MTASSPKPNSAKDIMVSYSVGGNEIKLTPRIVQEYIVGTDSQITMAEFKKFTELCKVRGLNPFMGEAYCIKYGSQPATIVVGKDVILKRAILHPQYDGKESGVITIDGKGEIRERSGCFVPPTEAIVGGWAKVYRKDWARPEYMSVSLDEVQSRKKDGTVNAMWATKTATMVEKVAKVRALREAFVDELGGMYDAGEMNVAIPSEDNVIEASFERRDPPAAKSAETEPAEPEALNFDEL